MQNQPTTDLVRHWNQTRDLLTAGFAAELVEVSGFRLERGEGKVSENRVEDKAGDRQVDMPGQ